MKALKNVVNLVGGVKLLPDVYLKNKIIKENIIKTKKCKQCNMTLL